MGDFGGAEHVLREASAALSVAACQAPGVSEQAGDLTALADQMRANSFGELEAKYMRQRAYNAHRGKQLYEEKLRRNRES